MKWLLIVFLFCVCASTAHAERTGIGGGTSVTLTDAQAKSYDAHIAQFDRAVQSLRTTLKGVKNQQAAHLSGYLDKLVPAMPWPGTIQQGQLPATFTDHSPQKGQITLVVYLPEDAGKDLGIGWGQWKKNRETTSCFIGPSVDPVLIINEQQTLSSPMLASDVLSGLFMVDYLSASDPPDQEGVLQVKCLEMVLAVWREKDADQMKVVTDLMLDSVNDPAIQARRIPAMEKLWGNSPSAFDQDQRDLLAAWQTFFTIIDHSPAVDKEVAKAKLYRRLMDINPAAMPPTIE